jgi:hypothetical protein
LPRSARYLAQAHVGNRSTNLLITSATALSTTSPSGAEPEIKYRIGIPLGAFALGHPLPFGFGFRSGFIADGDASTILPHSIRR